MVKNFIPIDYKSGSQNWCVVQDKSGLIYVGNNSGLLVYDGKHWDLIETPNSVRSIHINDSTENVYLGLDGDLGYMTKNQVGQRTYISLKSKIPADYNAVTDVWTIIKFENKLYFNSLDYIYVYKEDTITVIKPNKTKFFKGMAVFEDKLIVSEPDLGIEYIKNDNLYKFENAETLAKKIYCFLPYDEDNFLVATRTDGVFLYSQNKKTTQDGKINDNISKPSYFYLLDSILMNDKLYYGIQLNDQQYCFSTLRNGVVIVDKKGNIIKKYNLDNGLVDNTCFETLLDANQQIWVTTANGISLLYNNLPFDYYTEKDGLEGIISCVYQHQRTLYVTTDKYLYYKDADNKFAIVENTAAQNFMVKTINNQLVLLNQENGVMIVENKVARKLQNCDIKGPLFIFNLKDDIVFISSSEKKNIECGTIKNDVYTKLYELPIKDKTYCFEIDTIDNVIWFTTSPQLYKMQLDDSLKNIIAITLCDSTMGLYSGAASPFRMNDKIYFATQKGFYLFNKTNNTFEKVKEFEQIIGQIHYAVAIKDAKNNIWLEEYLKAGISEKT